MSIICQKEPKITSFICPEFKNEIRYLCKIMNWEKIIHTSINS